MVTRVRLIWDDDKNARNRRKHGISFELAAHVFLDPLHLSVKDRIENAERRWQTIGQIGGTTIVLVAHTLTDDTELGAPVDIIHIISARAATRKERKRYEEG